MGFRIRQSTFDTIVYLYPDSASAKKGERIGGSGCLIGRPTKNPKVFQLWVATNRHVIEQGNWTIRVNTANGGFDCIETNDQEWIYHLGGDDLAVRQLPLVDGFHQAAFTDISQFMTEEIRNLYDVGPGDPCFMVGRFVNHEGLEKNVPSARFGQIAQNPGDRVKSGFIEQESFLVEMRSVGGFSGSPVYVYLDQTFLRPMIAGRTGLDGKKVFADVFETGPWLLGINWAMVPAWDPVCDGSGTPLPNNWIVPSNTGMAAVVPAWKLYSLLMEHPEVVAIADQAQAQEDSMKISAPPVIPT